MKEANCLEELAQILSGSPFYIPVRFEGSLNIVCNPELDELEPWARRCADVKTLESKKYVMLNTAGDLLILKSAPNLYLVHNIGVRKQGSDLSSFLLRVVTTTGWEFRDCENTGSLFPLQPFLKAEIYLPGKNAEIRFYQKSSL